MASQFSNNNDDSILTGHAGASLTPVMIAPPTPPPIPLDEFPVLPELPAEPFEPPSEDFDWDGNFPSIEPFEPHAGAVHTETTTTRRFNGGAVGIVFGVLFVAIMLGLGLALFLGCGCCRRRRRTRGKNQSIDDDDDGSKPIPHLRVVPDGGAVESDFNAYPASHAVTFAATTAAADAAATADATAVAVKVMHTTGTETNHHVHHAPSFIPSCPVDTGVAAASACAAPADAGSSFP